MEFKEGMTFKEYFATKTKRSKGKNTADYHISDYLKYYRKTVWRYQGGKTKRGTFRQRMNKGGKWTITPQLYRKILTSINSLLLEAILHGEDIQLPLNFGILYARQKKVYTSLDENGKLKTNRALNWQETLKLWYEDKEARESKQVVYQDNCKAKPYFNILFGDFHNRSFLYLLPNTIRIREATKRLKDGDIVLPEKGTSTKAIKDI